MSDSLRAPVTVAARSERAPAYRIAMIHTGDPNDRLHVSGLPFAASAALARAGCDVVPIRASPPTTPKTFVRRRLLAIAGHVLPSRVRELPAHVRGLRVGSVLQQAHAAAARVDRALAAIEAERPVDAIVGMCISVPLAYLATERPIIYASDATARIVLRTYPRYRRRPSQYHAECEECETRALRRASFVALAAEAATRSAVEDYGVEPERVSLVPLGCHVVPEPGERIDVEPPTRARTRLLLVASDAERKRVSLAVRAVELLRARGIGAELWHVGAPHSSLSSRAVRSFGPLRLDREADRAVHRDALRATHISVLPSVGEAFGIAPAESAHFGRPAIVSDAGGLPTVVRDGETGIVLPTSAGPAEWARAVESLVADPARYVRLATEARRRAQLEFTWDRWAERMLDLVHRAVVARSQESR
ncbi:MAG: glycosyltransferase family 4 protein [Phycisphaerae bacterium]|nr:glycosyltransferase family 4 protein [Phycisphaerae bacterium]